MNAREPIKIALTSTQRLLEWYVSDLGDADLLVRPVPNANHIAWQLGHLISAESSLFKDALPKGTYPELPAGFVEQHSKEKAMQEPPRGFATKEEYLRRFGQARAATLAAVDKLTDADLDKPMSGDIAKYAPTLGALLLLQANHTTMHAGQFTVVRRKLGKPVLF
jgi:uncharacterized damage-inducible protein DinB